MLLPTQRERNPSVKVCALTTHQWPRGIRVRGFSVCLVLCQWCGAWPHILVHVLKKNVFYSKVCSELELGGAVGRGAKF